MAVVFYNAGIRCNELAIVMSRQDEYQGFFETEPTQNRPLIIDVPPAPPKLHRRYRTGLERPYRGVGVEFEHYEYEESGLGTVWQSWFILGLAIAFIAPAGIGLLMMGEWVIVLVAAPIMGVFLVGMVRSLLAEQKAKRAKQTRRFALISLPNGQGKNNHR